jgi:extracellular factor (EF) 3-hydroxypalmitic acid methyl ester biosynthesis protein
MRIKFEEIRNARRKSIRNTTCCFEKTSELYQVSDLSIKGFSFLCNKKSCFFKKGVTLESITFFDAENLKIIEASGTVVYVNGFDHANMRIGVSFIKNKILHSIVGSVRAPRYCPNIRMDATIEFVDGNENKIFKGLVVDYTAASTRIGFTGLLPSKAELGDSVKVCIKSIDKVFIEDNAIIIRKKYDCSEIILQFCNKFINVPQIETISEAVKSKKENLAYLNELNNYKDISSAFKALVCDWRMYFTRLKQILDNEDKKGIYLKKEEQEFYLKGLEKEVFQQINAFIGKLNIITDKLGKKESLCYKKYFRENLNLFLRVSPFVAAVIDKDRGYAGNFEIIKQLFDDPYTGDSLFAKMLNRFIFSLDAVTAHQDRIKFLYDMLCSMYEKSEEEFSFLVLGSGPGEEILRFVENNVFTIEKPVHASLLDMDAFALIDFKDQIQYLQVDNFKMEPIIQNLLKILANRVQDPITRQYSLTYCAGMFDYFSEEICKRIIDYLLKHTKPGGHVIVTNVHENSYARRFMDYGGEWELILRDEEKMINMAPSGYHYDLFSDENNANLYLRINVPEYVNQPAIMSPVSEQI